MPTVQRSTSRIVGRDQELAQLEGLVRRGASGLLTGPAGIGKTALLDEVARDAGSPLRVSAAERGVWVAADESADLVVVDDLEQADAATIGWVDGLVRSGSVPVLGAARSEVDLHPGLAALVRDERLGLIEIAPLGTDAIAVLGERTLGAPLAEPLVRDLASRWDGSPLTLAELLLAASELGAVVLVEDRWHAVAELPTYRLRELVEGRVARLSGSARATAELLAIAGPLPLRLALAAVPGEDLAALERVGLVRRATSMSPDAPREQQVGLAHPLHAEALAAGVDQARRRTLVGALAGPAARLVPRTVSERLRIAGWFADAGVGEPTLLEDASREAYSRMEFELAARLGLAAMARGGGYHARLAGGAALAELGRTGEARQLLRDARGLASRPLEAAWAAIAEAHVVGAIDGAWTAADEVLRQAAAATDDLEAAADIAAYQAVLAAIAGDVRATTALLDRSSAGAPGERARLLGAVAQAVAGALRLDAVAVSAAVASVQELTPVAARALPIGGELLRANHVLTLARRDGPAGQELRVAEHELAGALRDASLERSALWATVVGQLQLRAGAIGTARDQLADAVWRLERSDAIRLRPVAVTSLALAHVQAADAYAAEQAIGEVRAEAAEWLRIRSRVELVEAWLAALRQGPVAGAEAGLAAGDRAAELEHLGLALEGWHLGARLGAPIGTAVDRLALLEGRTGAPSAALAADHTAALLARDGDALEAVARRLAASGQRLLAAEAAGQAAGLCGRDAPVRRFAAALAATCPAAVTPEAPRLPAPQLSGRELDVAGAAATQGTTAAIADALSLSPRTVDNHLGAVYRKLGVRGRDELVTVFGGTTLLQAGRV